MSFDKVFPETGILHTDCWEFIETRGKFIRFVKRMTEIDNYAKFDYKMAEKECKKYDLPFVDVSWNCEKVLKETADRILEIKEQKDD